MEQINDKAREKSCSDGSFYFQEAIEKIGICGNDAVLVTGLGPVGLASLMLAKAMGANMLIGVETNEYRVNRSVGYGGTGGIRWKRCVMLEKGVAAD